MLYEAANNAYNLKLADKRMQSLIENNNLDILEMLEGRIPDDCLCVVKKHLEDDAIRKINDLLNEEFKKFSEKFNIINASWNVDEAKLEITANALFNKPCKSIVTTLDLSDYKFDGISVFDPAKPLILLPEQTALV